jgi:dephospho-CoA kinase
VKPETPGGAKESPPDGLLAALNRSLPIVGLVGGVASGKSFVAQELGRLGATIVDADKIGHEVLREPGIIEKSRERWTDAILDSDGQIVRSRLAKIVFAPPPAGPIELAFLERLTHPRIHQRLQIVCETAKSQPDVQTIVLDAPVLFKAGWNRFCNKIVFVDAPYATRLERARMRGWSEEDFLRREAAQESLDAKRANADIVLDNSGSLDFLAQQVADLWNQMISPPAAP